MGAKRSKAGKAFERACLAALQEGEYEFSEQEKIGDKMSGGGHVVDVIAKKGSVTLLISLKWQQDSGTTEEKVPYEVMILGDAVARDRRFARAILVLGGKGWKKSLKEFYLNGGLNGYVKNAEKVRILDTDDYMALANRSNL
jgi:hypothetical protein